MPNVQLSSFNIVVYISSPSWPLWLNPYSRLPSSSWRFNGKNVYLCLCLQGDVGPLKGVVIAVCKKLTRNQSEYNSIAASLGADYRWMYDNSCTHFIFQVRQFSSVQFSSLRLFVYTFRRTSTEIPCSIFSGMEVEYFKSGTWNPVPGEAFC